MGKVSLTVVTTSYNHEKFIEKCIQSIVSQKTNFKFELVISDDCSTDNTRAIIKKYQKKYPDIIKPIFREKNLGAMNNFIETLNSVHTKYVALCDGDDFWTDDSKLQKQYDFLEKHDDYSIVFHQTLIFYDDGSNNEETIHPNNIKSNLNLQDLIKENFIPANTVVYRWKYLKKDSLLNEFPKNVVPGDYFLHLVHANCGKIHFINKVMSSYRRQPGGMWYLTSKNGSDTAFHIKYGEKYLRFYRSVERILGLSEDTFKINKDWIIQRTILAYLRKLKRKDFKRFYNQEYKNNKEIIDAIIQCSNWKIKFVYYLYTNPVYIIKKPFKRLFK